MVNTLLILICIALILIFVLQFLNRQELLSQRDDIEMMRFRLKTIIDNTEKLIEYKEHTQKTSSKSEDIAKEVSKESVDKIVEEKRTEETNNYGFKTQVANIDPKRDDKIEYEEENFIIEEE